MLRTLCFILIASGGIVMAVTAVRYYGFIRNNRAESYFGRKGARALEVLVLLAMVFFVFGFGVGAADVFMREVEPIYLFVGVVFFVGACFVAVMVQAQVAMANSLRGKATEVMRGFVNSIEMKDPYTKGHSWHVYHVVQVMCRHLPPKTRAELNVPKLLDAALLHDVGKMGVPNEILNKKGPLTEAEWAEVKTHADLGKKVLADTCFAEIGDWVLYHHERMDGRGYHRLPADRIPLEARVIAVADTYSAMTTSREYRPKRSHEEAVEIMREVAGTQLDAGLVECFCKIPTGELEELVGVLEMREPVGAA